MILENSLLDSGSMTVASHRGGSRPSPVQSIWVAVGTHSGTGSRFPPITSSPHTSVLFHQCAIHFSSATDGIRRGADKSLAQPTSRYRRTEPIVSLERGVCSCADLQVFSCYRGRKEACKATRAISKTSRRKLSKIHFSCKAGRRRKLTPFWKKH